MTFVLTPQSPYDTITKPRAHFLFSLLEGLSTDFPSHMILSILDIYQDTTTRDKLVFLSAITCVPTHLHVTIPSSPLFYVMGTISKESIRRNVVQLTMKRPRVEPSDAAPADPIAPSSSRAVISFAGIMK